MTSAAAFSCCAAVKQNRHLRLTMFPYVKLQVCECCNVEFRSPFSASWRPKSLYSLHHLLFLAAFSQVRDRDDLSLTGFTNKVHEFVVTLGLNKVPSGIHVLGHSLGGAIAGNYGANFGKKDGVKLVTLVCPAMKTPHNRLVGLG